MISRLQGTLIAKEGNCAVIDVGGVGFAVAVPERTAANLPSLGSKISLATHLHVREDALELYGFLDLRERNLFERLNSVTGIGPKSALSVLNIAPVEQLIAAIHGGRAELLTRASGVGKKTAERITLELKGKLGAAAMPQTLELMTVDLELEDTLINLGWTRAQAKQTIREIDPALTGFKERLMAALKKRSSKPHTP